MWRKTRNVQTWRMAKKKTLLLFLEKKAILPKHTIHKYTNVCTILHTISNTLLLLLFRFPLSLLLEFLCLAVTYGSAVRLRLSPTFLTYIIALSTYLLASSFRLQATYFKSSPILQCVSLDSPSFVSLS